ncbi:hypothetical protein [Dyella sp. 2RAB6]|uniref:hypothetical protein n=1 Tax=Dyella sp. 2RAB6 TaxID=3232992 RepID=UPI003F902FE7
MDAFVNGLLTVLTSGIVSAVATTLLNFSQAERQLRRNKLEELCVAIQKGTRFVYVLKTNYEEITSRNFTLADVRQALEKTSSGVTDDMLRLNTLVSIYFPALYPELVKSAELVDELKKVSGDRAAFLAHMDKIIQSRTKLLHQATKHGATLNEPAWKFWR